jgi:hypothetical protein
MDTVMTGFVHEIIILIEKKGDNKFFSKHVSTESI